MDAAMAQERMGRKSSPLEVGMTEKRLANGIDVPVEQRKLLRARPREAAKMLIPFAGISIAYAIHMLVPNVYPVEYVPKYWGPFLLGSAAVWAVVWLLGLFVVPVRKKALRFSWLLAWAFLFFEIWDIATLKTGYLKLPFIPSPDKVLEQLLVNHAKVFESAQASLLLLAEGLFLGLAVGFVSGVLCGCSRLANYWLSPLLKIIGPVPGLVWLPVFVKLFGSSHAGSVAAIVLAVWFPMTLMLSNAIKNTDPALIERAQTLGCSRPRIVAQVMIPNAAPALADALFMSLAGSFGALSAAELCGVKSGLALAVSTWGTIANFGVVFAYVLAMIVIFATLTSIMFAVRNWLLRWQKGLVRW